MAAATASRGETLRSDLRRAGAGALTGSLVSDRRCGTFSCSLLWRVETRTVAGACRLCPASGSASSVTGWGVDVSMEAALEAPVDPEAAVPAEGAGQPGGAMAAAAKAGVMGGGDVPVASVPAMLLRTPQVVSATTAPMPALRAIVPSSRQRPKSSAPRHDEAGRVDRLTASGGNELGVWRCIGGAGAVCGGNVCAILAAGIVVRPTGGTVG